MEQLEERVRQLEVATLERSSFWQGGGGGRVYVLLGLRVSFFV